MAAIIQDWPAIPDDVIEWFRAIFAEANRKVSETLLNSPATHEPSLDDTFITALIPHTAPRKFGSGATVQIAVHNIGGLRHYGMWEVADIGLIAHVVRGRNIIASKVAVLQAKRLFPSVGEVEDVDEVGFSYGMNKWLHKDPAPTSLALVKRFTFEPSSAYQSLKVQSQQVTVIEEFIAQFGEDAVYYLMYNPPRVPLTVTLPIQTYNWQTQPPKVGVRVYTTKAVHGLLKTMTKDESPTFGDVYGLSKPKRGWRVEDWASREFLRCRVGRRFSARDDELVARLLSRRSGPIGAAIQVSIQLAGE